MQEIVTFLTNHMVLTLALIIVLACIGILESIRSHKNKQGLSVVQVVDQINHHHAVVIDIRSKEHFQAAHVINAISIALQALQADFQKTMEKFKTKPIILVCGAGQLSQKMALQHKQNGHIYYLSGGMRAWTDAHMPLTKDK